MTGFAIGWNAASLSANPDRKRIRTRRHSSTASKRPNDPAKAGFFFGVIAVFGIIVAEVPLSASDGILGLKC